MGQPCLKMLAGFWGRQICGLMLTAVEKGSGGGVPGWLTTVVAPGEGNEVAESRDEGDPPSHTDTVLDSLKFCHVRILHFNFFIKKKRLFENKTEEKENSMSI